MAQIADTDLRERCEKRLAGLKRARTPWEGTWRDIELFFQSRRSRWLSQASAPVDTLNTKIMNGTATRSAGVLANGMASGLSSPSRPWFRMTTQDPDLRDFEPVKDWLRMCQERVYELFASTNFYNAIGSGYRQLGLFGVEAAIMTQHWRVGAVTIPLSIGEYWIGINETLDPDSLYRSSAMTVAQVVQKFGDKVSPTTRRLYDQSNYDAMVPVYHAIEPNPERIAGQIDKTNMLFRSIYWEEGSSRDLVLAFDGFEQQPFWANRWEVEGNNAYGTSPAMMSLGDAKGLQLKEIRLQQHEDYINRPALVGPPQLQAAGANITPGGLTFAAAMDMKAFQPVWQVTPQVQYFMQDINRLEQSIKEHFYVDLFMAISQMEGVQPRNDQEIAERVGEKMTQLGPVVERQNNEKLRRAVDIAFHIVLKTGQVPVPPPELHGQEIKLEFISVLAQMQRAAGLSATERLFQFVETIAPTWQEAADNIDPDEAIRTYADDLGAEPKMIRTAQDVATIRAQRAQQAQAAQAAASAQPALHAAQATQALSQTDVGGGESALQRMLSAA